MVIPTTAGDITQNLPNFVSSDVAKRVITSSPRVLSRSTNLMLSHSKINIQIVPAVSHFIWHALSSRVPSRNISNNNSWEQVNPSRIFLSLFTA